MLAAIQKPQPKKNPVANGLVSRTQTGNWMLSGSPSSAREGATENPAANAFGGTFAMTHPSCYLLSVNT